MKKILFVCSGNVARSQMAEAFYNHLTNSKEAYSAGTNKDTPRLYPKIPEMICQVMQEKGIDVSNQKVKTITELFVEEAEQIFVMCNTRFWPNYLLNTSDKTKYWEIEDPYHMGINNIRKIRDHIERKVKSYVSQVNPSHTL
jgi:arsenate reductase